MTSPKKDPEARRVVAIIQARMSSRRLPGKVLLPLAGKPVLWHVVNRTQRIRGVDEVVVATSTDSADDSIEGWCFNNRVNCFRGPLDDVLSRYVKCAQKFHADVVVRITADCPVIDPEVSSEVLATFLDRRPALAALSGGFPDGLDTQVFDVMALVDASERAFLVSDREHVGPFIERNREDYDVIEVELFSGLQHIRLTLDESDDYELLSKVFEYFPSVDFNVSEALEMLSNSPEILAINSSVPRNQGYQQSTKRDLLGS